MVNENSCTNTNQLPPPSPPFRIWPQCKSIYLGYVVTKEYIQYMHFLGGGDRQGVRVGESAKERGPNLVLCWGRGQGSLDSD